MTDDRPTSVGVDAKAEYPVFKSWWRRTRPGEPTPSSASLHFDGWMASARRHNAAPAKPVDGDRADKPNALHERLGDMVATELGIVGGGGDYWRVRAEVVRAIDRALRPTSATEGE